MTTYGERLAKAIAHRSAQLGHEVTRLELANAAGCSRQNIGMILTNAQGDQRLSTDKHAKAAAFLKVNPDWLLTGAGDMEARRYEIPAQASTDVTGPARELAKLYDLIPEGDLVKRARAYNAASQAILDVLQER